MWGWCGMGTAVVVVLVVGVGVGVVVVVSLAGLLDASVVVGGARVGPSRRSTTRIACPADTVRK